MCRKLKVVLTHDPGEGIDPLFRYLSGYARELTESYCADLFQDMDMVFGFLQTRMEEFFKANPGYRKPAGLSLCYSRPSCCAPTITLSYLDQSVIISKPKCHESNPANPCPGCAPAASQH